MLILNIIILILGFSTSYTDIKFNIIKNKHLLVATIFGFAAYIYLITTQQIIMNWHLPLNIFIGFSLGFLLYLVNMWEAGDAKLFTVFCLLMPTEKYNSTLFFTSFAIFANIFITSLFAIIIYSIGDICQDKKRILKEFFSIKTLASMGNTFLIMFSLIWIIQAFTDHYIPEEKQFLSTLTLLISCLIINLLIEKYKNKSFIFIILCAAVVLRFLLNSFDSNIEEMTSHLKKTLFFTFLFQSIIIIFKLQPLPPTTTETSLNDTEETSLDNTKRIPFAPLILIGTLLTHTNLLNKITELLLSINK